MISYLLRRTQLMSNNFQASLGETPNCFPEILRVSRACQCRYKSNKNKIFHNYVDISRLQNGLKPTEASTKSRIGRPLLNGTTTLPLSVPATLALTLRLGAEQVATRVRRSTSNDPLQALQARFIFICAFEGEALTRSRKKENPGRRDF